MSVTLTNSVSTARIAKKGAEIKSIRENAAGIEYIWQSDPSFWTGAAPILFPIIGSLRNGQYQYQGQAYLMPSHGLVRKKDWDHVSSDSSRAIFETKSNEETRQAYPFDFTLRAHYTLDGNSLSVRYEVINEGSDKMYFSIGSHPAFNVPFAGGDWENYYYHFGESENLERYFLGSDSILNRTAPVFDNSRQIFLTKDIFKDGAIILKHPVSKEVSLRNSRNSKQIKIVTEGMPYLGLWAPQGAPFACIEPWHGLADMEDTNGEFTTKEGIITLDAGNTFNTTYVIEIS